MPRPGEYVVGMLYNGGKINGLQVYTQPGGPGTPVDPQYPTQFPTINTGYPQVTMTYPSLYILPCLHSENCLEVFSYFNPYEGIIQALICCNQCGYIVEIMSQADYYNYNKTPILVV